MLLSEILFLSATTLAAVAQLGYISIDMAFRSGSNFYRACRYREGERIGSSLPLEVDAATRSPLKKATRSLRYASFRDCRRKAYSWLGVRSTKATSVIFILVSLTLGMARSVS
jgi:hypothetical protein